MVQQLTRRTTVLSRWAYVCVRLLGVSLPLCATVASVARTSVSQLRRGISVGNCKFKSTEFCRLLRRRKTDVVWDNFIGLTMAPSRSAFNSQLHRRHSYFRISSWPIIVRRIQLLKSSCRNTGTPTLDFCSIVTRRRRCCIIKLCCRTCEFKAGHMSEASAMRSDNYYICAVGGIGLLAFRVRDTNWSWKRIQIRLHHGENEHLKTVT